MTIESLGRYQITQKKRHNLRHGLMDSMKQNWCLFIAESGSAHVSNMARRLENMRETT